MNQSLREKILGADDLKRAPFPAPEWDLPKGLFIRVVSSEEGRAFEDYCSKHKNDNKGVRERLAILVLCDADGKQFLSNADAEELGKKSRVVLDRISDVAMTVNGYTKEDVETLAGNLPADQSAISL